MAIVRALSKQLLGKRYESIQHSFLSCFILFFSLTAAQIKINVAPYILYLTTTFFTAGVMLRALYSAQNQYRNEGLYMLPFDNRVLTFSYIAALSLYTLFTKTSIVLVIIITVKQWNVIHFFIALLCACNSCIVSTACYCFIENNKAIIALIWMIVICLCIFLIHTQLLFVCLLVLSTILAILYLNKVDAYIFYRTGDKKLKIKHRKNKGSLCIYMLRYLISNISYLVNTFGLMLVALFLPFFLEHVSNINTFPLGLAILCMNTPICILVSSDPELEQAVRMLPRQAVHIFIRYSLFIFFIHISISSIYFISWSLQNGEMKVQDFLLVIIFALQSAILSVLLEWFYPIRNWKVENDLWHHPRKYIVPFLMIVIAILIITWHFTVILLLPIIIAEMIGLIFILRRI